LGKVGSAAVGCLQHHGHEVVATDQALPVFDARDPGQAPYIQADLTDAGAADHVVCGCDAVVHAAAIPEPSQNVPHDVFANNLLAVFNIVEACARFGVQRLVNVSSETVPGFIFAQRPFLPSYCPIDEDHPVLPQDPYALAKLFGEQLCEAATRRSDITAVSVRPSWVQWEGNYERNLGPFVRDPSLTSITFWSYIDAYDLAELLALCVAQPTPGHEVVYAASPDNIGGRNLRATMAEHYPDVPVRDLARTDASGTSISRARHLFGWRPQRSWSHYLSQDGQLRVPLTSSRPEWPGPVPSPSE
jgi:UDP-glucose 4-epimerase